MNDIYFYILSAILITLSVLAVISKRLILSLAAIILFIFVTGFLFLMINSIFSGILHIIISLVFIILLILLYKNNLLNLTNGNLFKTRKFWAGIIVIIAIAILVYLFSNYYISILPEANFIVFEEKAINNPILSILITTKSIFNDYFLAYIYVIFIIITAIGGISLLFKKKTDSNEGGRND